VGEAAAHLQAVLGLVPDTEEPYGRGVDQVPAARARRAGRSSSSPPRVLAELRRRVRVITAHELVIDGTSHGDIVVLHLAEGEEQRTVEALTELHAAYGFPGAALMAKIGSLLDVNR
jgi:hypothetical protein